jgi:hypothetical protein
MITGLNASLREFLRSTGAAASVAVSWLNWQLRGDRESAKRFVGEKCGLCQDARWSLEREQFPAAGSR